MLNDTKIRIMNSQGLVVLDQKDIIESFYRDIDQISEMNVNEDVNVLHFNKWAKIFEFAELHHKEGIIDHIGKQKNWLMPNEYISLDIKQMVLSKCVTQDEINRVELEYKMYEERNLINLLRYLTYLVKVMRENKIVWGVGRGSSVSSYILYLI